VTVAQTAPATDKNTKIELEEFGALLKSLGYTAKRNPVTITISNPALGEGEQGVFWRGDNNPGGIRLATAAMRAKISAPVAPDSDSDSDSDSASAPIVLSLAEQAKEINASGGALDTPIGTLISQGDAFTYKPTGDTYQTDAYPALKAKAKSNPPFGAGEKSDPANWTETQKNARHAFNVCFAWERKVRNAARSAGTLASATPRGDGATATDKTAKRASDSASASATPITTVAQALLSLGSGYDSITVGDIRFAVLASPLNPTARDMAWGELGALLSDRVASASTIPTDSSDSVLNVAWYLEAPAWVKPSAIVARDNASERARAIPDRVIAGAVEDASDSERAIHILIVGTQWETTPAKIERVRERYANVPNAFLYASVAPDGAVARLATPELLTVAAPAPASAPASASASVGTIPASILASVTASVDPASVPSQDAPAGMTASETAKLANDSASATPLEDAAK
jgi:hypothetical protein